MSSQSWGAEWPPMDHQGATFAPADGDVVWGKHENVGSFKVSEGATIKVKPYEPSTPGSGRFELHAEHIVIKGTLSGTGAGRTGGGGGGGGGGCTGSGSQPGGAGGATRYNLGSNQGVPGNPSYYQVFWPAGTSCYSGYGGKGGNGDSVSGPPAAGGQYGGPDWHGGMDGVYGALNALGFSVEMGAGGGGGSGLGGSGAGPGGGGAGGGCGGAEIRLFGELSLAIFGGGAVTADGTAGQNAQQPTPNAGAPGGSALVAEMGWPLPGDPGGTKGGAGSGGGVLLVCPTLDGMVLMPGSRVSCLGGRSQVGNAGVIKIFASGADPIQPGATTAAARVVRGDPSSALTPWLLYE